MPTISVIIPCFNSQAFVAEAIESVLRQTCPATEVIVVNDGSTDASVEVVRRYSSRVALIEQVNRGVSSARNVGIGQATGDYLLFLDADDLLHEEALERLAGRAAEQPCSVVLMGWADFLETPSRPTAPHILNIDHFFPEIIRGNFGPNHTRLVPRVTALRAGGFPEWMPIYEDWHFWIRVALTGAPLTALDYVGAYYRRHVDSCLHHPDPAHVIRAHVEIARLLGEAIPRDRRDLFAEHGEELFWAVWTALHRARTFGIPWRELVHLTHALEVIACAGPEELRRMHFARLTRWFGFRLAENVRSAMTGA